MAFIFFLVLHFCCRALLLLQTSTMSSTIPLTKLWTSTIKSPQLFKWGIALSSVVVDATTSNLIPHAYAAFKSYLQRWQIMQLLIPPTISPLYGSALDGSWTILAWKCSDEVRTKPDKPIVTYMNQPGNGDQLAAQAGLDLIISPGTDFVLWTSKL